MGKRWPLPDGMQPSAKVTLIGALSRQAVANSAPAKGVDIARTAVQQGDGEIQIVAFGEAAAALSCLSAGSVVKVTGHLVFRQWKTGQGKARDKFEVEVDQVKQLAARKPAMEMAL